MSLEQLQINYQDTRKYNHFWHYLSTKLEPLIQDLPLHEWIEMLGNKLYSQTRKDVSYIVLEDYFQITKIKACIHKTDLSVHARLINNGSSFTIELKDYGEKNDSRLQRFFLAHELAHTFFFNKDHSPFIDYKFFPVGSKEIEFLCNRISRSILIPNVVLFNKLNKIETPSDESFSLDSINKLCDFFRVPYNVLLNRIVFDTGLWNCLFLRFGNYETETNNWKLRERYLPSIYWNNIKAFIPLEDDKKDKDDPNRYPSAKDNLKITLDKVYHEIKSKKRTTQKYHIESISGSPLKAFLKSYFSISHEILIHFSLGNAKYSSIEYLNVCIPMPNNIKRI